MKLQKVVKNSELFKGFKFIYQLIAQESKHILSCTCAYVRSVCQKNFPTSFDDRMKPGLKTIDYLANITATIWQSKILI